MDNIHDLCLEINIDALSRLTNREYSIMSLRMLGYKYSEMSQILRQTPQTISGVHRKAVKKYRKYLKEIKDEV